MWLAARRPFVAMGSARYHRRGCFRPDDRPVFRLNRIALSALCLAVPAVACAQPAPNPNIGPYVSLGIGPDFLQKQTLHPANAGLPAVNYGFSPGVSGYVSLGYGLGGGLRLEIEGNYADTRVSGASGVAGVTRAGGYEQQYGGFVNAFQDFARPFALPITPFLGIGAGYQAIDLNGVNAGGAGGPIDSVANQSEGGFAYQGIAGISAPLGVPGLDVTAEYRMIGTVNPSGYHADVDQTPTTASVHNSFTHELLIGLRLLFGGPQAPAPAPALPAPVAVPAPAVARTYLVFFDWDKADLTDRARAIIAEAAKASARVELTRIEVDGYTDLSGSPQYNKALSLRRANAVAEELVRDGVARADIFEQGYGETHPLVPTAKGVREPQNRRVEIILK